MTTNDKTSPDGHQEFSCELARFEEGARYNGALSGMFDLEADKEGILPEPVRGANAFAYLFRRFGPPIHGWDEYKELCRYYLTTPMEGVFLDVCIGASRAWFGYLLRRDIDARCRHEEMRPMRQWDDKLQRWASLKHRTILIAMEYGIWPEENLRQKSADTWLSEHHPGGEWTEEISREFWEYKSAECAKLMREYRRIEPGPRRNSTLRWREYPEEWTLRQVGEALCAAMRDLLRPVFLRDCQLDLLGLVEYGQERGEAALPRYLNQTADALGGKGGEN